MGELISSENSLNQHIKLKHRDLWDKLKSVENSHAHGLADSIGGKDKPEPFGKSNELNF